MTRSHARAGFCLVVGAGLVLGLLACGDGDGDAPAPPTTPAVTERAASPVTAAAGGDGDAGVAASEARQIFATRCTTCHGERGAGDGPGSAGLTPQPRNLQSPAWQSSVTDTHIEQIILYGGAAVALSPAMPGNPDLNSKPAVVTELRKLIRALESSSAAASPSAAPATTPTAPSSPTPPASSPSPSASPPSPPSPN